MPSNTTAYANWCFTSNNPDWHVVPALYKQLATDGVVGPTDHPSFNFPDTGLTDSDMDAIVTDTNNSDTWVFAGLKSFACQYERGEGTSADEVHGIAAVGGTLHLQGILCFGDSRKRFSAVQRLIPGAHWEVCRSVESSRAYCTKLSTRVHGPFMGGVWSLNRASARDWDEIWGLAAAGKIMDIPADVCSLQSVVYDDSTHVC